MSMRNGVSDTGLISRSHCSNWCKTSNCRKILVTHRRCKMHLYNRIIFCRYCKKRMVFAVGYGIKGIRHVCERCTELNDRSRAERVRLKRKNVKKSVL